MMYMRESGDRIEKNKDTRSATTQQYWTAIHKKVTHCNHVRERLAQHRVSAASDRDLNP